MKIAFYVASVAESCLPGKRRERTARQPDNNHFRLFLSFVFLTRTDNKVLLCYKSTVAMFDIEIYFTFSFFI